MRFVIQRVLRASVSVDGKVIGQIDRGFLVLVGVSDADTEAVADRMVHKLLGLRIFNDAQDKINLNLEAVGGSLLIVSQFTLYADCRHGNRPSFVNAGSPDHANALYEYVIRRCAETVPNVQHGSFGARMAVDLINDGPFTIVLDSEELGYGRGGAGTHDYSQNADLTNS